jgi:hypothetical protein
MNMQEVKERAADGIVNTAFPTIGAIGCFSDPSPVLGAILALVAVFMAGCSIVNLSDSFFGD